MSNTVPPKSESDAAAHWHVVAAFFSGPDPRWLDDFIADPRLSFRKVLPPNQIEDWHHARGRRTSLGRWFGHLQHARRAFSGHPDGIITCFPQLAMCCAIWRSLRPARARPTIVAYNFNLGSLAPGPRRWLARTFATQIDVFAVHSPRELAPYAAYLGVPEEKVRFFPLQRGEMEVIRDEDEDAPFVLAMGSAGRDYPTLIEAADKLSIRTVIVTKPEIAAGLPKSPYVEIRSGLTQQECLDLLARCRVSVTPVANLVSASGQVTFVNSLRLGVPTIATDCPGTDGYIDHDLTGLLVRPFDADDLADKLSTLWNDKARRDVLAETGRRAASERFSDEAVSELLRLLLLELEHSA